MRKGLLVLLLLLTTLLKAQTIDIVHYKFEVDLTDRDDTINGKATIKIVANKSIQSFDLDLIGDGTGRKGMIVKELYFISPYLTAPPYIFKQNKITVDWLAEKGDTFQIIVSYKGVPDDGLVISRNKFGDRTFFADNWPNRAQHWLPCNDRPDDKATFEFMVDAPAHYTVVSNGIKKEEIMLPDGTRRTIWAEDIPLSPKVMVIGVARFATKTYDDSPEHLPISAWLYPQDSAKGVYDFVVVPEMVRFFSDYIAPFPYKKLANVQSTTIFGGMENASCIFYDEKLITGKRSFEDVIAHEVAHQWFGDMVTEKSFAHLWLSEGFATYLTNLYWEKKYGKEAMQKRLQKDRAEVIAFAKRSLQAVVDSTENLMLLLNANSYQKGGWVLHMLRNEVGDSLFHQIVRTFYHQYKGGNAETRDFEAVAEKISGKELTWFFDQWLYQGGVPTLDISWEYKNGNVLLLPYGESMHSRDETMHGYKLKTELLFLFKNGKSEKHTFLFEPYGHAAIKLPTKEQPVRIILDPDTKLLFEGKISAKKSR
jgi:aminopeptidase N